MEVQSDTGHIVGVGKNVVDGVGQDRTSVRFFAGLEGRGQMFARDNSPSTQFVPLFRTSHTHKT